MRETEVRSIVRRSDKAVILAHPLAKVGILILRSVGEVGGPDPLTLWWWDGQKVGPVSWEATWTIYRLRFKMHVSFDLVFHPLR